MNSRHKKTLQSIFSYPASGVIDWSDIEDLLIASGARVVEGRGSRVRFVYKGIPATFHRPHPGKEARPYQIRDAKKFLETMGVTP
jgi:hypothetical protein